MPPRPTRKKRPRTIRIIAGVTTPKVEDARPFRPRLVVGIVVAMAVTFGAIKLLVGRGASRVVVASAERVAGSEATKPASQTPAPGMPPPSPKPSPSAAAGGWRVSPAPMPVAAAAPAVDAEPASGVAPAPPSSSAPSPASAAAIESTFAGARADVNACYTFAFRDRASGGGEARVSVTLAEDGQVAEAHLAGTFADSGFTDCVLGTVRALRFPAPGAGHRLQASYAYRIIVK